jgi:UDP-N-acetylmuramate dehydrogenase
VLACRRMLPSAPDERVALAPLCTLGLGGAARWFSRAGSPDALRAALVWCGERGIVPFVLGGGSNLVISDAGWPGLVLAPALRGVAFAPDGDAVRVTAAAGEPWDALVEACVARGLAGIECLSGIPGSVGGTPIQNVGAYGQEVSTTIGAATVLDRRDASTQRIHGADCGFAYRQSRFKREDAGRFVVLEVEFLLCPGGAPTLAYPELVAAVGSAQPTLAAVRAAVLMLRRRKGMVLDSADPDTRSVGSFFMNPVVTVAAHAALRDDAGNPAPSFAAGPGKLKVPAAWLIERAGLAKGHARGAVGLSTKHPLAIVNRGGATAAAVVAFAREVQRRVADRFGIVLLAEPTFVGFGADPDIAALRDG